LHVFRGMLDELSPDATVSSMSGKPFGLEMFVGSGAVLGLEPFWLSNH